MKKFWILFLLCFSYIAGDAQTTTFIYTGGPQTYTVPPGVTSVTIDIQGAKGGGVNCMYGGDYQSIGGCGGRVQATLAVTPGQVLNVIVAGAGATTGAGGYGGGGTDYSFNTVWPGAGGGGGTTIADNATGTILAVAGGGGGGGGDFCTAAGGVGDVGGAGGNLTGAPGNCNNCGTIGGGGQGGTQIGGGAVVPCGGTAPGQPGALGVGGDSPAGSGIGGGGGGGGYYGGASGSFSAGGGGGSSYTNPTYITLTPTLTQGYDCGNGVAIITIACTGPAAVTGAATSACIGGTIALSDASSGGIWSSLVPGVATVNSASGVVTGVAQGITTITYTLISAGGCYQTYLDTTKEVPTAITGAIPICAGSSISLNEAVLYGTWSSSNSAVATVGLTTGTVTGIAGGTAVITYSNTCGLATTTMTVYPAPGAITGPTSVCPGSTITLSDAVSGGTWTSSNSTVATVGLTTGVVGGISAGTSTIIYTTTGGCIAASAILVNQGPPAFTITPPAATFCSGYQMLTVPVYSNSVTTTYVQTTGAFTIPNNTPAGTTNTIAVAGIPASATIYALAVELNNVAMNADNQLTFNIQSPGPAPNNLNLVYMEGGGSNRNFTNTIISSAGVTTLGASVAPFTGTYAADNIAPTGPTLYMSNTTTWSSLYTTPNGNWLLCARDWAPPTTATVNQWSLIISYAVPVAYTWAPATGLYTNPGLTVPYVAGTVTNTVYASPAVTTTYTATATLPGLVCTASGTATMTIGGGGTIIGPTVMCSGSSTTLSASIAGGTWSSSNPAVASIGSLSGVVTTGTVATGASATTVISYNNICVTTETLTVNGPPGTISGTTNICSGGATTTLSDASGGTWSSSNPTVASVNATTGLVTSGITGTSGTTTITYSNGCGSATTTTFSVTSAPAAIIGGPATICSGGATVTLSDATAGGTWSSGTVAVASVGSLTGLVTSGVLTTGTSGATVITYSNGCGTAPTTVVTVNAPPNAISGNTTICSTLTTTLSDVANGTWSSSNVAVASVGALTGLVTGGIGGTSVITYSNGCGAAVTTVTVIPPPAPITGATLVCSGSTTTLSDAVTGGTWSSGNVPVASVGSLSGQVTGGISGTSVISYSNGCGATQTISLTVPTAPTIISGTTTICLGLSPTLSNNGTPVGTWSSSNVSVATINSVTGVITSMGAGTTTITAANLCGSTTTLFTVSNPTPITGVLTFCQDDFTTLSDGVTGGTWSSGNLAVATATGTSGIIYGAGPGIPVGCAPITYTLPTGCITTTTVCTTSSPAAITGFFSVCVGSVTDLTDGTPGGVWTSTNTGVATVGSGGDVHGISGGNTVINYTIGSCYATQLVTVNPLPSAITGPAAVCVSSTIALSDATSFGNWSVSNTNASINISTGAVTGLSGGVDTVTYTLGTGCITTTTIMVNPLPAAISGNMVICYGQTSQLSDATPLGTWSSSAATVANVTVGGGLVSTGSPALPAGGTTIINYTLPTGCTTEATFTVNPLPGPIIGATAMCAGTMTSLTDAPAGGTWNSSNVAAANIGVNSGVVTAQNVAVTLTTTITYSMGTGCTATTIITVNPQPAAITGNQTICAGQATQLSDVTGSGMWTSSATTVATVTPGPSPASGGGLVGGNPGLVTSSTTFITYTLPTSCSVTTTVMVNPLPGPIIGATAVCSGLTTALTDGTSGGTWMSSNTIAAPIGLNTGIITAGNVGNPTPVTITYTLPTGCTKTVIVTVNPLPTVIAGNTTVCAGLTTTLSDGSPGGTWSSNNVSVATIGSLTGTITGNAQGTATVTYSLNTGCLVTAVVTVNPVPAAITGATVICVGSTTQLSDITPNGTWSSSVSATATIGLNSGLVTGGNVPLQSHTGITYTLSTGCIAITTVTVNPLPTVIGGTPAVCAGLTTTLSNGTAGGIWTSSNTGVATIGSLSGIVTGIVQGTTNITYTLGSGCTQSIVITVNPLPAAIAGNTTICAGLTTQLSDGSTGGTWSSSATTIATIGLNSGLVTGGNVLGTAAHSGITYTLPTGCIAITTVTVNPLPTAITGASALCQGTTIDLSDAVVGGSWSGSNSSLATIQGAGGTGIVYADTAGGIVGVDMITYTLGTGCITTKTVTVNLQPAPITGGPLPLCQGATGMLSDATGGGVWSSGNSSIATVTAGGMVTGHNVGNTPITYSIGSCSNATSVFVYTQPGPISGVTAMCNGSGTVLSDMVPGGVWSAGNTTVSVAAGAGGGVITSHVPGIDTISYTEPVGGCLSTATVIVNVQPGPIMAATTGLCDLSSITLSDATAGGVWSSSNTNAGVGPLTGIVTGTMAAGSAPGTSVITYTEPIGGCSIARVVTINTQPVPITGTTSVCLGDSTQLFDATTGGTWTVSPSTISIASISSSGMVTGLSAGAGGASGYAIIDWTVGSCAVTTTVTVNPLPSPVSGIFYVCQYSSTTLGDLSPSGTWSSNAPSIATVDIGTGVVYGADTGTATITYTLPTGCTTTHTLTVIQIPAPIGGYGGGVCAGETIALNDATPGGAWTSGNTTIATIPGGAGGSGIATGVSSGTAIISYTLGSGCNVVAPLVVNPLSPVTGAGSVCIGQTINLSDTTVGGTWSSSNASVATVNHVTGEVTGVAAGTVNISYILPTGCTATAAVTVNALPAPITPGAPQICDGLSITLSDATPGGVWSSGNVNVAMVLAGTGVVTGSGNTGTSVSTVIITYTSGCFITATVTVEPLPQAITGNPSVCLGLTTVLSDVTPGGTWSSSNATIATVDVSGGVVTGNTAGSATIFYTIGTGCSASLLVTVYPLPALITGATICVGSTVQLSDSTTGGAWFSSDPSVASIGFVSGIVTGGSGGMAVITYQVATGCTQTTTVIVNPLPSAVSPSPASVCVGSTINLYSPGGTTGTWTSGTPGVATIDPLSGILTGVTSGTSLISYTIGTGCAATEVVTVNPDPGPITGINTVCIGMTTNLSDATPGGVWISGNPSIGTVDPLTGVVYDSQPGSFVDTYKLATGCYTDTLITVNVPPTAILGATAVCVGSTATLSDAVPGGTWTSSTSSVATIDPGSGILTGVSAGSVIVTYTMGGGSCFLTQLVTVNPLPAVITGTTSVCAGLTTSLSDGTGGGTWSSMTTSVATIDPNQGVVTGITAGTSEISYTLPVTGCASTVIVTVNPLPVITGNTNICLGGTQTLSSSLSPGAWSSSNAAVTTVGPTGIVYGNGVGVDNITYTLSATGCIRTTTVAVHPLPAVYTVTGGGSYCSGGFGVPIGLSGSQTGVEYLLYLGSTPTGTFMGTGSALNFGLQATAGTYTVVAVNTFTTCSNSMTGSATVTINVSPVPSVSIGVVPGDTVCAGTLVTYTAAGVNGGATPSWQWSVNGTVVGTGAASYSYTPSNGDTVSVSMTSMLMCANPVTVSAKVGMNVLAYEAPSLSLLVSPADTVCVGAAVTLTAVPSYGGSSPIYLWTVDGLGTGTAGPVYTYVPSDGDIVYCRMVSDYRCRLADTVSSGHEVITVDTPVIPAVSVVSSPGWTIGQGSSDTLHAVVTNGGTSPTYQWFINGVPVAGATTSSFVDNNFSYPNEDSVGCLVKSSGYCPEIGFGWLYIIVNAAGVQQISSMTADLSVVPNPNSGVFLLKGTLGTTNDEEVSLELTDVLGQAVYKELVQTYGGKISRQISVGSTLANGMYMLSVHSASVNRVFHIVIEQ